MAKNLDPKENKFHQDNGNDGKHDWLTPTEVYKQLKDAILYGMGYVCGKHNLNISKKERNRISSERINELKGIKKDLIRIPFAINTSTHENGNTVLCGVILKELKKIIEIDYKGTLDNEYWDGTVSFSGVKRMIYGLWSDGKNEKDEDMLKHMSPMAKKKYKAMIKKYSKMPKMSVFL